MKKISLDIICRREVYIKDDITDPKEICNAVEKMTGLPIGSYTAFDNGDMVVCSIADENNKSIFDW